MKNQTVKTMSNAKTEEIQGYKVGTTHKILDVWPTLVATPTHFDCGSGF